MNRLLQKPAREAGLEAGLEPAWKPALDQSSD
jgi:hypothetical protein